MIKDYASDRGVKQPSKTITQNAKNKLNNTNEFGIEKG